MKNINIKNYGVIIGRLTRDPKVYLNRDGSRKILFTIAAIDNYKSNGQYCTQFVSLEAFVSGTQKDNGVYDYVDSGDLLSCAYSVQSSTYTDKDGRTVYRQVLQVTDVALLESKAAKEARQAKATQAKAVKNETSKETKQAKTVKNETTKETKQAKAVKNTTTKETKKSTGKQTAA